MATKPTFKLPKSMAVCADRLYTVKQERLAQQKAVDALQAEETALKEHIIKNLPKSQATGVAGKLARVTVKTKTKPRVTDWEKVWAYIRKKRGKADDLLQRRVADAAVEARWERGEKIDGIEEYDVVTVSINKV